MPSMADEAYKTPSGPGRATLTEKKSEFIAQLAPAASEAAALAFLDEVRAAQRGANHNVYAYRLWEGARARYSDDGEPAKTAGLPVLEVLQHAGLYNCVLVVTRYFGGTLLGTGGLVRAYGAAARAAVEAAPIATVRRLCRLELALPYPLYEQARRILDEAGARLDEPVFAANVRLAATLPAEAAEAPAARLRELLRGGEGLRIGEARLGFW